MSKMKMEIKYIKEKGHFVWKYGNHIFTLEEIEEIATKLRKLNAWAIADP